MKYFKCIFFVFFLSSFAIISAQDLSFGNPINFLQNVQTDKAIDVTSYKGGFFVTWKEEGKAGQVHVSYLGRQYETSFTQHEDTLAGAQTAFAPVLRTLNNRIYLLWIAADGSLKYIINSTLTGFNTKSVFTFSFKDNTRLSGGITAAALGNKLMFTSHADDKQDMVYAVADVKADGTFSGTTVKKIPDVKSSDYPFLVSLNESSARITYKGYNEQSVYYIDYDPAADKWKEQKKFSSSGVSPAVYHVLNNDRLFYIWKGAKSDNRIYYSSNRQNEEITTPVTLPEAFTTRLPVSICSVDDKKFIVAYVGSDNHCYLSYFTNYSPAKWMGLVLFPSKENSTLKDIVIPGAHDAGMSVLSGTGGAQSGTINECNTLTQVQDVEGQLNAGIRMFDLRIGSFKDSYYAKHCSSDCMSEAIGGGYGEKFETMLAAMKAFLHENNKEFLLLTLSHFCEKEASAADVAAYMIDKLGKDIIYAGNQPMNEVKLSQLSGKIIISFEKYARADKLIDSCSIATGSKSFINFRREYAATDVLDKLLQKENIFFKGMSNGVNENDLIRLDWQLTQAADEAALICNDFQNEKVSPLVNGAMLLTNVIRKHKSIRDLSLKGNKSLPLKVNEWIKSGVINKNNKPNILYVDVAGGWITDYCVELNSNTLYNK